MKPRQIGGAPLVRIVSVDDRLEEMRQQLEEMTRDESLDARPESISTGPGVNLDQTTDETSVVHGHRVAKDGHASHGFERQVDR